MKRKFYIKLMLKTLLTIFIVGNVLISGKNLHLSAKDELATVHKKSNSPLLKLAEDKKGWKPVEIQHYSNAKIQNLKIDPGSFLIYDIGSRQITKLTNGMIESVDNVEFPLKTSHSSGNIKLPQNSFEKLDSDGRVKISPTVDFPWRTICKLYITFPDGSHFVGTGAIIGRADNIGFHCLTAGHCAFQSAHGGWAESIEVIPALDNDYMPFYSSRVTKIKSSEGWIENELPEYNWACLTLDRQIGNFTGWMGRYSTEDLDYYKNLFHCAGYPGDLDFGLCMYYNSDYGQNADNNFHWYFMNTHNGQSGMPVWSQEENLRFIVSVHTDDNRGDGSERGVRLNTEKFNLLNQWINEDSPPVDLADLIDDGPAWSGYDKNEVVAGYSQFKIWNDLRNVGTATSAEITITYYASVDNEIDLNVDFVIGTNSIDPISPFSWRHSEFNGIFPENIPSGEYYIGWIIDSENTSEEFDEENNVALLDSKILIVKPPYFAFLIPNGGEVFEIGKNNIIKWQAIGGSGLVGVDASFDNGNTWKNLVTNSPDSGAYHWDIRLNQIPSFSCLIKITDMEKNFSIQSAENFIIETPPSMPGTPQDEGFYSNNQEIVFSWTEAEDPESDISAYQVLVGTSQGGNDIADELIENSLNFTATGQHGQTLYARVRAQNGVGLLGPWSEASNGILIDLTPPVVLDSPTDIGKYTGSDSVTFDWNEASDEESGIVSYHLEVGTSPEMNDIFDGWLEDQYNYQVIGQHNQSLFARVQAENGAGNIGEWSEWSDGILIDLTPPGTPSKPYSESKLINVMDVPIYWGAATESESEIY